MKTTELRAMYDLVKDYYNAQSPAPKIMVRPHLKSLLEYAQVSAEMEILDIGHNLDELLEDTSEDLKPDPQPAPKKEARPYWKFW